MKANYNSYVEFDEETQNCNCEIKLLKLKANYNSDSEIYSLVPIVIAR